MTSSAGAISTAVPVSSALAIARSGPESSLNNEAEARLSEALQ